MVIADPCQTTFRSDAFFKVRQRLETPSWAYLGCIVITFWNYFYLLYDSKRLTLPVHAALDVSVATRVACSEATPTPIAALYKQNN